MEIDYVVLVSRWLHIVAVVTAIGGAIFQWCALWPTVSTELSDEHRVKLLNAVRGRWARLTHISIAILVITGGLNFYLLVLQPRVEPLPYHAMFGFKLILAMIVFFLATALTGRSPAFEAMRRNPSKSLLILIVVAFFIILISGGLSQVRDLSPRRGATPAVTTTTPP